SAKVDSVLAVIGQEGEEFSTDENQEENSSKEETKETTETPEESKSDEAPATASAEIPEGVNIITKPRLSDTTEGRARAEGHNKGGEKVKEGDILAEIETDKAVQEFESEFDGTLLFIGAEEGKSAPVDTILAIIGPEGTDVSGIAKGGKPQPEKKAETPKESKKETAPTQTEVEKTSKDTSETQHPTSNTQQTSGGNERI